MPDTPSTLRVTVVYAEPDHVFRRELTLPSGASALDAIAASGLREQRPELMITPCRIGIFSRKVTPDTVLADGDRVEIYRPLRIDPKQARRQRARR